MKSKYIQLLVFFVLITGIILPTAPVHASTIWVVQSTADVMGNCPGVTCTLRGAIFVAQDGDTITFNLPNPSTITLNSQLQIGKSITISGPGASKLSISGNNASRIFYISPNTITVSISGLTIKQGHVIDESGGGIYSIGALTLDNVVVTGNTLVSGALPYLKGGGIYNGNVLTVTNSQINNNTSVYSGGGIYNDFGSSLSLTSSTVSYNALTGTYTNGAGVSFYGGNIIIDQSYVFTNTITQAGDGAGIYIVSGAAVIVTNSFISNNIIFGVGNGAGIFTNMPDTFNLSGSTIGYNHAYGGNGGGIILTGSHGTISNSTIENNIAAGYGGGIYTDFSFATYSSTISNNEASIGGGISIEYNQSAPASLLENSTVAGNHSSGGSAGGISNSNTLDINNSTIVANTSTNESAGITSSGMTNLKNSILANNIGMWNNDCKGDFNSLDYNLIEDFDPNYCNITGQTGHNITGIDPMLDVLSDNGGQTVTISPLTGSPVIDAANNATCTSADQRGYTRPQDGDWNGSSICDIGAFEFVKYPAVYSITRLDANPTSSQSINYQVKFTEPVSNVDTADFQLTTAGGVSSAFITNVTGTNDDYTVTVDTGNGDGTIRLDLLDDDTILATSSGDTIGGAGTGNGNFTGGEVYLIKKSAPAVQSITRVHPSPTAKQSVGFKVIFNESVIHVDASDFLLTTSGNVSGASITTVSGVGAEYTVTINTGAGDGSIRLDLADDNSILGALVNDPLGGASAGDGNYSTGENYNINKTLSIKSNGEFDGHVLESSETSSKGGTINNTASTFNLGDDSLNRQYRSILSFDTTVIPSNATITKVVLKIKKSGVVGSGNPISIFKGLILNMKKGTIGSAPLEIGDFKTATDKTLGPITPTYAGNWYTITLTDVSDMLNKNGNTQIRLRLSLDDNNNAKANYLKLYSGNSTSVNRPVLIVEYSVP